MRQYLRAYLSISVFAFAVAFVLHTHCTRAATDTASDPRLGINLAGPADWNTELPFVNVFRMSRPWISQRKGADWGKGPELSLDEYGWVKRLEPDCRAETPLCTIGGGHYPSGQYTVFYDGSGKFDVSGAAQIVASEPGKVLLDVDASRGAFFLRLMAVDPADYVRNIRVIMPGFAATYQQNPFHPVFLERWKGMTCFRFMDWMDTNGSQISKWTDRPTLQHATFSKRGVALEWMIDLCNRTQVDPWFCIPHLADDDFVRRFAQMVRDRLDPARKIYVEYSNEVWNAQFPQYKYACEQGLKLGLGPQERPWEAGWHYTALRSMEIFAIWEDVLGGHQRLIRVLPSQAGNIGPCEAICSFRDANKHADALAVAPYMPFSIGRGKTAGLAQQMKDWSAQQMLDYFEEHAFKDSLQRMARSKAIADKYGLKLLAYEGGQHMVAFVKDRDLTERLTATMKECNRDPRMGEIYKKYFDEWARIGGGTFAVFSSISRWTNHGCWGLAEFYDSTPAEYPKLEATLRWAKEHGQPVKMP